MHRSSNPVSRETTPAWFLPYSLICAVLAGLLFLPGLHSGFIFDDTVNITANPAVHMEAMNAEGMLTAYLGKQPGGTSRILPTLSIAFDYWRSGGLNAVNFKITNVAIHVITMVVLAGFLRLLLTVAGVSNRRAALWSLALASAWGFHPLQVSSVLYVVQRMQTMCTLFILLALWAYLKARQAQIEGKASRSSWLLMILAWVMALGCKEDAVLLPAYTLALELTVLGFRASKTALSNRLKKGYLFSSVAAAALFFLVVVPHYWSWDKYPGRDFSTLERLFTQARVLCIYIKGILLPVPLNLPFFYDWIRPSSGLLQPWTTLPASLLLAGLLSFAWLFRTRFPLFAFGVFLFFAGHFITSNVIGLELAFEHRNHLPLLGILLATGELLRLVSQQLNMSSGMRISASLFLLTLLGVGTLWRANSWGSPLSLAETSTRLAPNSSRAWLALSQYYYQLGGEKVVGNPYLGKAIAACENGAANAPYSVSCSTNLIVFKTATGKITDDEWNRYLHRLQTVNMGPENNMGVWVLITNVRRGIQLDPHRTIQAIDIFSKRYKYRPSEYGGIGYFILGQLHRPKEAYPYFVEYVRSVPADTPDIQEIIQGFRKSGQPALADQLQSSAISIGRTR